LYQAEDSIRDFHVNGVQTCALQISYPELQFILADAAQKGIISGDAEMYYEQGVVAAFEYVDTGMPTDYLSRPGVAFQPANALQLIDRKSTRLNSSHVKMSYAVFCLKKKR